MAHIDENPYQAPHTPHDGKKFDEFRPANKRGWPGWIAVLAIVLFVTLSVVGYLQLRL